MSAYELEVLLGCLCAGVCGFCAGTIFAEARAHRAGLGETDGDGS